MVMTHSIVATPTPKAWLTTGRTVLTTLPSSADMKVPTPTASNTHQLEDTPLLPGPGLPVVIGAECVLRDRGEILMTASASGWCGSRREQGQPSKGRACFLTPTDAEHRGLFG